MSPYEQIRAEYEASEHDYEWDVWMAHYMARGFVFSTPDFFAMGEPMAKEPAPESKPNCWYIFAMAGDMSKCWSILPWPLEWIAFERIQGGKRDLRFYRTETLRRLSSHESKPVLAAMAEV